MGTPHKSEAKVVAECRWILDNLRGYRKLTYRTIHVPRPAPGDWQAIHRAQQMAGLPDMHIYLPEMRILHIEFKSTKGRQREAQKNWQDELEQIGHKYYLVRDVEELKTILKEYDITPIDLQNPPHVDETQ